MMESAIHIHQYDVGPYGACGSITTQDLFIYLHSWSHLLQLLEVYMCRLVLTCTNSFQLCMLTQIQWCD